MPIIQIYIEQKKQGQSQIPSSQNTAMLLSIYPNNLAFLGYNVHVFDGGAHADNMEHFAEAINDDFDIIMHDVETNPHSPNDKQIKSLYYRLKDIDSFGGSAEYVAIPGLCTVSLQNLQDQYEQVMGEKIKLTPSNIGAHRQKILNFLKTLSEQPDKYRRYINYLDPNKQGIEWTYKAIQEINRLTNRGFQVYIPAGHAEYQGLKYISKQQNKKAELQHYISTGKDVNEAVRDMSSYIKKQGWYDFNLLNLSNAHIVNLKDPNNRDYLYSAYDTTITDGARGVYNFYPVRDSSGRVKGYSYTDKQTVEYPYNEFLANDEIADLLKFVGKKSSNCLATQSDVKRFKQLLKSTPSSAKREFSNKLFNINDVFTSDEIRSQKLELKGKFVDSSLQLFFDKNSNDEITFPNCNCEGSDRPSVMSMWGSCFAVFNAIDEDIERQSHQSRDFILNPGHAMSVIEEHLEQGRIKENYNYKEAEGHYNYAIEVSKQFGLNDVTPYIKLGDLHNQYGKKDYALGCYNQAIDITCRWLYEKYSSIDTDILRVIKDGEKEYDKLHRHFVTESRKYRGSFLRQVFTNKPADQAKKNEYLTQCHYNYTRTLKTLKETFKKVGELCYDKQKKYDWEVCSQVIKEIEKCTSRGSKVIERRSCGVQGLGDIFDEISQY